MSVAAETRASAASASPFGNEMAVITAALSMGTMNLAKYSAKAATMSRDVGREPATVDEARTIAGLG